MLKSLSPVEEKNLIDSIALKLPNPKAYMRLSNKEKENLLAQYNGSTKLSLQLDSGEFVIDQHPILQNLSLPYKESIINVDDKWYYVLPLSDPHLPQRKEDIMGKLIAEYQIVLEEHWLLVLNKAYTVNINEGTLKKVYKNLEKL